MAAVVPGLPATKQRSEVSVKILKGPVHPLESRRIHFPTSLAQAGIHRQDKCGGGLDG